jgi:fluoride exporter
MALVGSSSAMGLAIDRLRADGSYLMSCGHVVVAWDDRGGAMTDGGPDEHRLPVDPDRVGRGRRSALAFVALGGALGAPARYEMSRLIPVSAGGFPWATFWTNVSGSLVLGFILVLIIERFPPSRHLRAFVAVGFLGAYTTYSTFMVESDVLVRDGHAGRAAVYVLASSVVGLAAAWIGMAGARRATVGGGAAAGQGETGRGG